MPSILAVKTVYNKDRTNQQRKKREKCKKETEAKLVDYRRVCCGHWHSNYHDGDAVQRHAAARPGYYERCSESTRSIDEKECFVGRFFGDLPRGNMGFAFVVSDSSA